MSGGLHRAGRRPGRRGRGRSDTGARTVRRRGPDTRGTGLTFTQVSWHVGAAMGGHGTGICER
ncbi:hypothetical protein SCOCK_610030 [Actinacidiphila cocklensis]|uniref:Uncharacterized protein n=1 Tax=Actinacidiphila cocklensis TaxID=887465 RepID=A0A9W4E215_9ACTN|nr:hypothetical protein SCOCK_610030 [Actinacidiphila cocklensis]